MNCYLYLLKKHRILFLSVLYIYVLALLTLGPFDFSVTYLKTMLNLEGAKVFTFIFRTWDWKDVLLNVILFTPLGFLLKRIELEYRFKLNWSKVLFTGFCLSLIIESTQFFLDRSPGISDITTNSAGTVLGYWLTERLIRWHHRVYRHLKKSRWIRFTGLIIYAALIIFVQTTGIRKNHLLPWGKKYPLILGNEATEDRPWQGDLFNVLIFNQALMPSQVKQLFNTWGNAGASQMPLNPVVAFHFAEGEGNRVCNDPDLKHTFCLTGDSVHWLHHGGIHLQNQIIRSHQEISALYEEIISTGEFSVAFTFRTADLKQSGPARIISSSKNQQRRNFTVGQVADRLQFRVCTPLTGVNGSLVRLDTKPVLHDHKPHHAVFTFNHGIERFFWQGKPHSGTIRFDLDYLPRLFHFGKTRFGQFGFLFVLFMPFAFVMHGLFKKNAFLLTILLTMLFAALLDLMYWIVYHQPASLMFIGSLFVIAVTGSLTGVCFHDDN